MAKGLKVGDAVTVREDLRLPRKTDAYKQGLRRLRHGDVGHIVSPADGRSVNIEFNGIQVTLASQRLERAEEPQAAAPAEGKRRGRRKAGEKGTVSDKTGLVDYNSARFITVAANTLLAQGGQSPDPETVVVQIKLADLPDDVQKKVKSLMQAKLELSPEGNGQPAAKSTRGRKPKQK